MFFGATALLFRFRRCPAQFILVGDPKQLQATVFSQAASKAGLKRALFERLHSTFDRWGCLRMLNLQYRMHREICLFPSAHFYGRKLLTAPSVQTRPAPAWYRDSVIPTVREVFFFFVVFPFFFLPIFFF